MADMNQHVADLLLKCKAIILEPEQPFTWASGWKSPIYCDNRITLSFPVIRNFIREQMARQIEEVYGKPDIIAGVATGAIGVGALVADYLNLPFCYVRPEAKKNGRQNQIEGLWEAHQNVVVVEDLISTGKSSLAAVEALKAESLNIKGMMAIFTYGFPVAEENFKKAGVDLYTLSDYATTLEQAEKSGYVKTEELELLAEWRKSPDNWDPKMQIQYLATDLHMNLESKTITVNKSAEELCDYLGNVSNFEQLMPDNISKFEVLSDNSFIFALKGMPEIGLELKESDPPKTVRLGALSDKIPFNLTAHIDSVSDSQASAKLVFDGDFNPMMAMMIKGPITKFLETLSTNLESV